jgi:hypothetical protein
MGGNARRWPALWVPPNGWSLCVAAWVAAGHCPVCPICSCNSGITDIRYKRCRRDGQPRRDRWDGTGKSGKSPISVISPISDFFTSAATLAPLVRPGRPARGSGWILGCCILDVPAQGYQDRVGRRLGRGRGCGARCRRAGVGNRRGSGRSRLAGRIGNRGCGWLVRLPCTALGFDANDIPDAQGLCLHSCRPPKKHACCRKRKKHACVIGTGKACFGSGGRPVLPHGIG